MTCFTTGEGQTTGLVPVVIDRHLLAVSAEERVLL